MCGIAGFMGEDAVRIARLAQALRHRGPDHQGTVVTHGASLGYARLAILDPRPEGNQPMWSASGRSVIVYNGEIYNYRTLREREHLTCRTNTDTEVLLELYEKKGPSFVSELSGMFAFAIYDTADRCFLLARDTSGMKPLYLSFPDGKLHFASELKVLLQALRAKPMLDMRALSLYLTLQYVPGPETLCSGLEQLPAGTVLRVFANGRMERSAIAPKVEPVPFTSRKEFKEQFPALMDRAVAAHLVSDRPLGIFLSGGMDSSIVLHHMVRHAQAPVRTFTVRFDARKEEEADRLNRDADLAKLTAQHYGTDHHEILFDAAECRRVYAATARALDQPNADSVAMAQFVLAREAKKIVDVVLCGAGGDELFGGYPRYRVARCLSALGPLRHFLKFFPGIPPDIYRYQPGPALAARLLGRPNEELQRMVRSGWFKGDALLPWFERHFAAIKTNDTLRAFMEVDRATWLVNESLRLADGVTMAHGLEARMPYLDPKIIASAVQTPGSWHVTLLRTKALLKDTYLPLLPPHLRTLPKASFFPPFAKWIRRECAPLVEESLEHSRIRELFNVDFLRGRFEDHKRHVCYSLHSLSSVIQLKHWFEEVYDAKKR